MKPELLTDLFTRADAAEIGIEIKTNNPTRLIQLLSDCRREHGLWSNLVVVTPSIPETLFIVHKTVELDP